MRFWNTQLRQRATFCTGICFLELELTTKEKQLRHQHQSKDPTEKKMEKKEEKEEKGRKEK